MTGLHWAVRSSFLRYVSALPDGRCRVSDGASLVDGPAFLFPQVGSADNGTIGILRFSGRVQFTAHLGMLSLTIADPWLDWSGDEPVVTISGSHGTRSTLARCLVASDPITRAWRGHQVRLSEEGAELFGGSYAVGEELDPFVAGFDLPVQRPPAPAPARVGAIRLSRQLTDGALR